MKLNTGNILINNTIHVSLLFLFLTLFFYLYVTQLTKKSYESSIDNIINSNIDTYLTLLSKSNNPIMSKALLKSLPLDQMINNVNKPTPSIDISNAWVKSNAIAINILIPLILILTLFVLYITCNYSISLYEIIIKNIILFIFIALIEYMFFSQIASKYIVTSHNALEKEIIQSFLDNSKSIQITLSK